MWGYLEAASWTRRVCSWMYRAFLRLDTLLVSVTVIQRTGLQRSTVNRCASRRPGVPPVLFCLSTPPLPMLRPWNFLGVGCYQSLLDALLPDSRDGQRAWKPNYPSDSEISLLTAGPITSRPLSCSSTTNRETAQSDPSFLLSSLLLDILNLFFSREPTPPLQLTQTSARTSSVYFLCCAVFYLLCILMSIYYIFTNCWLPWL